MSLEAQARLMGARGWIHTYWVKWNIFAFESNTEIKHQLFVFWLLFFKDLLGPVIIYFPGRTLREGWALISCGLPGKTTDDTTWAPHTQLWPDPQYLGEVEDIRQLLASWSLPISPAQLPSAPACTPAGLTLHQPACSALLQQFLL